MKKKRWIVLGIILTFILNNTTQLLAAEQTIKIADNTTGTADVPISCDFLTDYGYIVTLPAVIGLSETNEYEGYNYGQKYKIGVQGNIMPGKVVIVRPQGNDLTLQDRIGKKIVPFVVDQEETEWTAGELNENHERIEKDADVYANIRSAGNYHGDIRYEFFLSNEKKAAGLYDSNGNMLKSWDELVNLGLDPSKEASYIMRYTLTGNLILSDEVTLIGNNAFAYCSNLSSVVIPETVISIGNNAFYCCNNLQNATMQAPVTTIKQDTFKYCTNLTSITIPDTITTIEDGAFYCCNNLKSVDLPDSVVSIGRSAFENCTTLNYIRIPDTVESVGNNAFLNVPHIYYDGNLSGSPWGAFNIN